MAISFIKNILLPIIIAATAISCVPNPKKLDRKKEVEDLTPIDKGYSMIFYRLDNYAMVYIDNQFVLDTREAYSNGSNQILFDLNEFNIGTQTEIKVEGYNTECTGCQNNNFEFVYEIFKDGEGIDYVSEYSNNKHSAVGLSMTKTHSIDK